MTPKTDAPEPDEQPPINFGDWLLHQAARRGAGSALATSRLLGLPHSTVNAWIKGHSMPGFDNQKRIADALGIPYTRVLVASGAIDADELYTSATLDDFSTADLLAELAKRTTD